MTILLVGIASLQIHSPPKKSYVLKNEIKDTLSVVKPLSACLNKGARSQSQRMEHVSF
jgi:hypothetical protein